ncbi:hypothetical protein F511_11408 [Dorcoceras hygrometricum]|uniref:Uncharacterized protein n=1 Tax=Dorcoceras hygrometricum TaxID=472368 RepID=A0A2Z7C265_9LAMI|nr:hypothetical protein F511_11408 [Dorcoceras hygrometricum]
MFDVFFPVSAFDFEDEISLVGENFELKLLLVDIARSVRLSEEVTRVSQHFGVLTINSADDYLDSADTLVKERSADDYLDSADTLVKERSADDYLDSADTLVKERSADDYLDSADTLVKERSADDYLDSADTLVKERSADGLRAADRYDGDMVTPETRQAIGYTVRIYILPSTTKIAVEIVEGLVGKSRVKKTPVKRVVSKKRPAVAVDEQVMKKKRTLKAKAAPSKAKLKLVSVALDVDVRVDAQLANLWRVGL